MRRPRIDDYENRVIGTVLRDQAEHIGDSIFLMDGERRSTFAEVHEQTNKIANALAGFGVGKDRRVTLVMENSDDMVRSAFAINKLGAAWTTTGTDFRGAHLLDAITRAESDVLVTDAKFVDRLAALGRIPQSHVFVRGGIDDVEPIPGTIMHDFDALSTGSSNEVSVTLTPSQPSAILWTSGTTGRPKGVVQSHHVWLMQADFNAERRGIRKGDVIYCCMPMYNSGGWTVNTFPALVRGIPMGIDAKFSVSNFWDRIRHYGATHTFTVGAMHMFLWNQPERPDDADNPLRGAGMIPMPPDIKSKFAKRFGIEDIYAAYGQSEIVYVSFAEGTKEWKPGSSGKPVPGITVRMLDDDDREVPTGSVGEICIRTDDPWMMFSGYFNNAEATAEAFRNGWFHTGDLGRFDEDGELFFADRKADYIRYKGRSVASFEVESLAINHPAVAEVGAVGVTSEELEHEAEIKLFVMLKEGQAVTAEELARYINDNGPYYLVPRFIEFIEEMPHNENGKLQKFLLRKRGRSENDWDRDTSDFKLVR
ncbi:class I adenylate-forming enzyme family protein [Arthrobacter sp. W4I7]|uniref:class I adenylate-forming enzyme family protein n=1 Tax=Arthrobacter sp. W4I7 TaxID=3042296 RepID=UPI0027844FF4|nr:AMP-binding protein [Arthrobacter sp. W4I7]MDQ0691373.1 crotonobetaine/carnitine-CoA ligase [Arthrobacter sp. W4I7]